MLTFLTTKIWHHAHSTVTSSYTNSKGTHAAYEDVLFHENDKLQTEKNDKNKRWTTFTGFLRVANWDSNASIGVILGLVQVALPVTDWSFQILTHIPICDKMKHKKGAWKRFLFLECAVAASVENYRWDVLNIEKQLKSWTRHFMF